MEHEYVVWAIFLKSLSPKSEVSLAGRRQINAVFLQSPLLKISIRSLSVLRAKRSDIICQLIVPTLFCFLLSFLEKHCCFFLIGIVLDHEGPIYLWVQVSCLNALNQFSIQAFLQISCLVSRLPKPVSQAIIDTPLLIIHDFTLQLIHYLFNYCQRVSDKILCSPNNLFFHYLKNEYKKTSLQYIHKIYGQQLKSHLSIIWRIEYVQSIAFFGQQKQYLETIRRQMDESSLENSRASLHVKRQNSSKRPAPIQFLDVEDLEDENEDHSPDKLFTSQKKEISLNEDSSKSPSRTGRIKSARGMKLKPLKGQDPTKISIDVEQRKEKKGQTSSNQSEQDNTEEITKRKMKKQRNKILIFNEEDEGMQIDQEEQNRNKKNTLIKAEPQQIKKSQQVESYVEVEDNRGRGRFIQNLLVGEEEGENNLQDENEIRQILDPDVELSFMIRRDKEWLSKIRPLFHFHYRSNNQYFFSAKLTSSNANSTIIYSSSKNDFTENGPHYIGKLKGNFTGSEYNIFGPGYNPSDAKEKNLPLRTLIATIEYQTNFFGSARPRNFRVYILSPNVSYYSLLGTKKFSDEVSLSELYDKPANRDKIMVFTNKKPEWNEEIEGYMLNFGGKVKKASVKNFILEDQSNPENARMVFGKVLEDEFRMDVGHPLSPFIAAGIAISAFGSKIGCE